MVKSDVYSSPIVFAQLDMRVGKVLECTAHPNSERHYTMTVDIGKGETLSMVQELQPYFSEEELVDRKVCVICNHKMVKVVRTRSTGQILTITNSKGTVVELLEPQPEAEVGERVYASGEDQQDPVTPIQMKKNKVWDHIYKGLKTNNKMQVMYLDRYPVRTRAGPIVAESLKKCEIVK